MKSFTYDTRFVAAEWTHDWGLSTVEDGYVACAEAVVDEMFSRHNRLGHAPALDMMPEHCKRLMEISVEMRKLHDDMLAYEAAGEQEEVGNCSQAMSELFDDLEMSIEWPMSCANNSDAGCWNLYVGVAEPGDEDWTITSDGDFWELRDGLGNLLGSPLRSVDALIIETFTETMDAEGFYPNVYLVFGDADYQQVVNFDQKRNRT